MLKTTPNFALLDPLGKLGDKWARSLYDRNLRNIFHGHPQRGCWARCIKKKEKKKVHG